MRKSRRSAECVAGTFRVDDARRNRRYFRPERLCPTVARTAGGRCEPADSRFRGAFRRRFLGTAVWHRDIVSDGGVRADERSPVFHVALFDDDGCRPGAYFPRSASSFFIRKLLETPEKCAFPFGFRRSRGTVVYRFRSCSGGLPGLRFPPQDSRPAFRESRRLPGRTNLRARFRGVWRIRFRPVPAMSPVSAFLKRVRKSPGTMSGASCIFEVR